MRLSKGLNEHHRLPLLLNNTPNLLEALLQNPQAGSACLMRRTPDTDVRERASLYCNVQSKELGNCCLVFGFPE